MPGLCPMKTLVCQCFNRNFIKKYANYVINLTQTWHSTDLNIEFCGSIIV